jgi:hypothetical protein
MHFFGINTQYSILNYSPFPKKNDLFFVFEFDVVVVAFVAAADVVVAAADKSSMPKPTQIIADFFPIIVIDPTIPFSPINEDIILLSLSGFGYLFVGRAIPNGMTGINGSSRISTTDGNDDDDDDDDDKAAESPVSVLGVCIDVIFVCCCCCCCCLLLLRFVLFVKFIFEANRKCR